MAGQKEPIALGKNWPPRIRRVKDSLTATMAGTLKTP
jgi:hypothetical protein